MGYDGLRRVTAVNGGPVERRYVYRDIDSARTTLQVASVTSGGQRYGYTYDSMGNIATYSAPGKGTVTYTYDNQGQLLSAAGDTTYTYTYDGAGNILTANGHTYTYGDLTWKDLLTAFDGNSISYDAIGNPTSYYNGTRWNFTWANGRSLATASDGTNSLSFAYDAGGLRTSKTVNGTTYRYYYAGGKLMRMTWGTNTIDFFYDANGTPYAMKYNGTVYYYITNLQGDVMRIVDANGTVMASYDYDPYGKVLSATGTLANINPLHYRGYVCDQETGFYYLQSRYYDPEIGRFINADTFYSTGQGIVGCNMFAYCGNNGVTNLDVTGSRYVCVDVSESGGLRNVTKEVNFALFKAAEEAVKIRTEVYYRNAINGSFVPASALGAKGTMYGIFINWVNHKADWDIKRQDPWNRTIGTPYPGSGTKVIYNGYVMTPEDIGNFTYGYLGRAFDFSETELIIGSWVAASFPLGGDALENELRDQEFIRMGYAWNGIN